MVSSGDITDVPPISALIVPILAPGQPLRPPVVTPAAPNASGGRPVCRARWCRTSYARASPGSPECQDPSFKEMRTAKLWHNVSGDTRFLILPHRPMPVSGASQQS